MGRTRLALALGAFALAAATTAYGCSIYDASLLLPANAEGGTEGGTDSGEDALDPCNHARWPARPDADDPGSDIEVLNAARTIDFGIPTDGGPSGVLSLDLDSVCTCPGPESCKTNSPSASHCDDDAGRDNAAGVLLREFAQVSNGIVNQDTINQRLETGQYTILVRVRRYNGKANDTQVEVSAYVSNGLDPVVPDAGNEVPKWDGTDRFTVDTASVFGGTADAASIIPNYVDTKSYVADYTLVATLDNFPFTLGTGQGAGILSADLTGTVVVAKLEPVAGTFKIASARVVGRWATKRLLASLENVADPLGPGYICPGKQVYENIKARLCRGADITADPKTDNTGAACDALSLAVGFTMQPARFGAVTSRKVRPSNCADAAVIDCN